MKPLLLCLAAIAWLPLASSADEVIVDSIAMPDEVVAYFMDDFKNSGLVSGPPAGKVNPNEGALQIGDVGNPDVANRVRKEFILFHLPDSNGKKLARATLRLYVTRINQEAAD